ncbi:hypothetical protein ANRL4_01625 [Anaerolineae bacterium]|nr:hypothetical protein ANRL4_01625 [Anaerolineae bacterium]
MTVSDQPNDLLSDEDDDFLKEKVASDTGVEDEKDSSETEPVIMEPFDPTAIRMETRQQSLDVLIKRLRDDAIDLHPDFQRAEGIWNDAKKSRLIESILIRIPLPAFYMDATDEDRYLVIDGLQRLTTLKRFVVEKSLKLTGLEFLRDYEDKGFDDLPRGMQRRIEETQVTVYLVQRGTPSAVKFNIFKRINTGGEPLSPQEIRNALNQGPATQLLKALSVSQEFRNATDNSVKAIRMADKEIILRALAFMLTSPDGFKGGDLDGFLNDTMVTIGKMSPDQREVLQQRFLRAMRWSYEIFGNKAYRKLYLNGSTIRRGTVSKPLFETWVVNLDLLDDEHLRILRRRNENLIKRFAKMQRDDEEFLKAITYATGDRNRVKLRFERIQQIIQEVLNG